MASFYAINQHRRGYESTFNGRSLDRLHRFDSKDERDAWVAERDTAYAVTARDAARAAKLYYGAPLAALERAGNGSELAPWPTMI